MDRIELTVYTGDWMKVVPPRTLTLTQFAADSCGCDAPTSFSADEAKNAFLGEGYIRSTKMISAIPSRAQVTLRLAQFRSEEGALSHFRRTVDETRGSIQNLGAVTEETSRLAEDRAAIFNYSSGTKNLQLLRGTIHAQLSLVGTLDDLGSAANTQLTQELTRVLVASIDGLHSSTLKRD